MDSIFSATAVGLEPTLLLTDNYQEADAFVQNFMNIEEWVAFDSEFCKKPSISDAVQMRMVCIQLATKSHVLVVTLENNST